MAYAFSMAGESISSSPLSRLRMVELPAVLDIEASGFGRDSYPIEVGFVLPDGQSFCTLIRPAPTWTHWDPGAEEIHHITRETLARHGRSVDEVARLLNERLHGLTVFSDGWSNDYTWLAVLFDEAGQVPRFKLESLRKLLSDTEANQWHDATTRQRAETTLPRHRASNDAKLLQMTLHRLRLSNGDAAPANR
jgi:hypothetical protein